MALARAVLLRAIALAGVATSCVIRPADQQQTSPPSPVVIPCTLAADSPDREAVETRCDGIDNDCDGLVDFLMPVAANACKGTDGTCASGYAACDGGQRVCLAPGPSPEVLDGEDNDCNGVVDDVPAANATPRGLLMVPNYLWSDSPEEVDTLAASFEAWGLPFDRPAPNSDWTPQFGKLGGYSVVVIAGYLLGSALDDSMRAALEAFASSGGIVVVIKPTADEGTTALALAGLSASQSRTDLDTLAFDGTPVVATRVFESPEERKIPMRDGPDKASEEAFVLTPLDGNTVVAAHAIAAGAAVGALVTRRAVGSGAVYALGHDLHSFDHTRCYINCFEPSGDMIGLFVREALRESARGHFVVKHTVPGPEDSVYIITHDVDAPDAQNANAAWGDPGALQVARVETAHHVRGTYLVTTDYVTPYYNEQMVKDLCSLGMCPISAHSVEHANDFATQPKGTCQEVFETYQFARGARTLCGEVRVSQELLQKATGLPVRAWRSPYLYVNPALYDVLETAGIIADSTYAVGDIKVNLPISLARTGLNQDIFHHRQLYSFTIATEDGIGAIENGVETRTEMRQDNAEWFVSEWTYTALRNAANGAYTTALLHPSYGRGVPQDNLKYKLFVEGKVLDAVVARGLKADLTMAEAADFWRAREGVSLSASYASASGYAGSLTVGPVAVTNLTLEFGDAIRAFTCDTCGAADLNGRRVTLRAALAPGSTHTFTATPGLK